MIEHEHCEPERTHRSSCRARCAVFFFFFFHGVLHIIHTHHGMSIERICVSGCVDCGAKDGTEESVRYASEEKKTVDLAFVKFEMDACHIYVLPCRDMYFSFVNSVRLTSVAINIDNNTSTLTHIHSLRYFPRSKSRFSGSNAFSYNSCIRCHFASSWLHRLELMRFHYFTI